MPSPHPEFAGQRIKQPGDITVYWVDVDGTLRAVQDMPTYLGIFRTPPDNFEEVADFDDWQKGKIFATGSLLAKAPDHPEVYLIDLGWKQKRLIASPAAAQKNNFDLGKVQSVPEAVLLCCTDGALIQ